MSKHLEPSLRFALDETITFREGQGINQLLSISLTPKVRTEESGYYVFIKGSLHLTGEFMNFPGTSTGRESLLPVTYIDQVRKSEGEVWQFSHDFPIDVTIPIHRITNISDVKIETDSFEYYLNSVQSLNIVADLVISGLDEKEAEIQPNRPIEQSNYSALEQKEANNFQENEDFSELKNLQLNSDEEPVYLSSIKNNDLIANWPITSVETVRKYSDLDKEDEDQEKVDSQSKTSEFAEEEARLEDETSPESALEEEPEADQVELAQAEAKDENEELLKDKRELPETSDLTDDEKEALTRDSPLEKDLIKRNEAVSHDDLKSEAEALEDKDEVEEINNRTDQVEVGHTSEESLQASPEETSEVAADLSSHDSEITIEKESDYTNIPLSKRIQSILPSINVSQEIVELDDEELELSREDKSENRAKLTSGTRQAERQGLETAEETVTSELEDEVMEDQEEDSKKSKKSKKGESFSITEFLAREVTEEQARLKLCFVQEGETVTDLAERYEVSQDKILQLNNLEERADLVQGQVVYIPSP